jgi:pyridoxine 5-phosphate synthase
LFAEAFHDAHGRAEEPKLSAELKRLIDAACNAHALDLQVNAGHGLNYVNLALLQQVPHLVELNIGHSIVSRAVFVGLSQAVKEMLEAIKGY